MKKLPMFFSLTLLFQVLPFTSDARLSQDNELAKDTSKTALFDHIYQMEGVPTIKITTDIKSLIEGKLEEPYQDLDIEIKEEANDKSLTLAGQIRARGNARKKVSYLPPVKLKFEEETLNALGFSNTNKLKLVFPADNTPYYQEQLLKEFLLYEIYSHIDSNYMRTKLVNISIEWKGKEKYQFQGFIIEDKEAYKERMNLNIVESGVIQSTLLEQTCFSKMVLFQYMIANTDWSVAHKHNLSLVKIPHIDRIVAMPYDFDFSGFVGHAYAHPHPVVPIESVHERYIHPHHKLDKASFDQMTKYYLSIEKDIYAICDQANYLKPKTIKKCKNYLASFFDLLKNSKKSKEAIVKL